MLWIKDAETELEFEWNEAHTVNVYFDGKNTDCFSIGNYSKDKATLRDFKNGVKDYINSNIHNIE